MEIFRVKTYGWKELGLLYSPQLTPESAAKRLKRWVLLNEPLSRELIRIGWNKNKRILSPLEVEKIICFLGEP